MLIEIRCDKFIENGKERPPILFRAGLNTVIGEDNGGNSIGKSTFLMIIDFAFGGTDYVTILSDVQSNVKDHVIKFAFEFDGVVYRFSRSTVDYLKVCRCDDEFNELPDGQLKLENYLKFLAEKYGIKEDQGSFRAVSSRFFRIYNRTTLNERRPLDIGNEKPETTLNTFLNIFGLSDKLKPLQSLVDEEKKNYEYIKEAEKRGDRICAKNATEYNTNRKRIESITAELKEIDDGLATKDSIQVDGLAQIDRELSNLQTRRSKVRNRLRNLEMTFNIQGQYSKDDFLSLQEFFPDIDIQRIEEVESFHTKLSKILMNQAEEEKLNLINQLDILDSDIAKVKRDKQLFASKMEIKSTLSYSKLTESSSLIGEANRLKMENKNYKELEDTKARKKEYEETLKERKKYLSQQYIDDLNADMDKRNKEIGGRVISTSPRISLTEKATNYTFYTPNDQGAGTQYKGLILFDLAMLELTCIPALIHDSDLLKPVGDNPVDGIAKQYMKSRKQIFIAIDKVANYNITAQDIFNETCILTLHSDGGELFGRSWSKEKKN